MKGIRWASTALALVLMVSVVSQVEPAVAFPSRTVALTFDDGPSAAWTPAFLTLLARHHVRATFCLIGRQVPGNAALVHRIATAGHALCDHTWSHDLDLRSRPVAEQRLEVHRAWTAIRRASGGIAPAYFRAPGGWLSASLIAIARVDGMQPLAWNVDPRDWARPGVAAIVRTAMQQLRPGAVVLLHDGGGDRSQTLAALTILLDRLPRLGYHFVLPTCG